MPLTCFTTLNNIIFSHYCFYSMQRTFNKRLIFSRESDKLVTYKHCTNVPLMSQLCKLVQNRVVHSYVLGLIPNIW